MGLVVGLVAFVSWRVSRDPGDGCIKKVTNAIDETKDEDGEDVGEEDVGEEDLNEEDVGDDDVGDDDVDELVSSLLSLVSQIAQHMSYELGEQEKMILRRRIGQQ